MRIIRVNKKAFTLIEMVLVITLIAIALGAMAFPLSKALKKEKFERGVDAIIARITFAQEIMLDFHTDVTLTLLEESGKVICTIEPAIALPAKIEKALNHHKEIPGISQLCFNHEIRKRIEICFDGTIGAVSRGTLTLSGSGREAILSLPGYPTHIQRGEHEAQKSCFIPYPEEP